MKDKLLKIIQKYGIEHQQRKLEEEVFELQQAITLYEYGEGDKDFIKEELGDVLNILEEIQLFYGISNLDGRYSKIDRQLERIENEKNNIKS